MTKALIHICDKRQAQRVVKQLQIFGIEAKVVHWRVSRQGADGGATDVEGPNLGLYVPDDQVDHLTNRLAMLGTELLVLKNDPVATPALDKRCVMDKYVVVAHMQPRPKALAIVDTENTEFVTLMDFSDLPEKERRIAEEEAANCLQFMANELNRLHHEVQTLLAVGPTQLT